MLREGAALATTRRTILKRAVQLGSALAGAVIAIPAVACLLSPAVRRGSTSSWRPLGRLDSFTIGQVQQAVIGAPPEPTWPPSLPRQGLYVWRRSAQETIVFSRACTDLGCGVTYDTGSACFFCPCHGGIFNQEGQRLAGPPQRPLYRYDARVRDGVLEIDLRSAPAAV